MFKKILEKIYINNPELSSTFLLQKPIANSNLILFKRYKNIIEGYNQGDEKFCLQELNMCQYMIENIDKTPIDKQSRWIGYIQKSLIVKNFTTIELERNFSRILFHNNYKEMHIKIPETITINS